jgi:hypothetical protein
LRYFMRNGLWDRKLSWPRFLCIDPNFVKGD